MCDDEFNVYVNYHEAIECIRSCETVIEYQQDQIGSRDERIASLEDQIVHMSLELASAKAREEEQSLIVRKLSSSTSLANTSISASDRSSAFTASFAGIMPWPTRRSCPNSAAFNGLKKDLRNAPVRSRSNNSIFKNLSRAFSWRSEDPNSRLGNSAKENANESTSAASKSRPIFFEELRGGRRCDTVQRTSQLRKNKRPFLSEEKSPKRLPSIVQQLSADSMKNVEWAEFQEKASTGSLKLSRVNLRGESMPIVNSRVTSDTPHKGLADSS